MALSPSQNAVSTHGCSGRHWVRCIILFFSLVNRASHSGCIHSRKCHISSWSLCHDGHRGCALDACNGSLSLMNSTNWHWSSGGNGAKDSFRTCQWTLLASRSIYCSFVFRYCWYGGVEVAFCKTITRSLFL